MKKIIFVLVFIYPLFKVISQPISPLIAAQSYHNTDWSNVVNPTKLSAGNWLNVSNSKSRLIRIGGTGYNTGGTKPTTGFEVFYVSMVDDVRSHGCEPVLTLPFVCAPNLNNTNPTYVTALAAAVGNAKKIIKLINVVHKRNLRYVVLANEPGNNYQWDGLRPPLLRQILQITPKRFHRL